MQVDNIMAHYFLLWKVACNIWFDKIALPSEWKLKKLSCAIKCMWWEDICVYI